jgi:hypothetical protein
MGDTMMKRILMTGLAMAIGVAATTAGEPELPVTATLVAKQTTYPLDLGGMTAEAFKKAALDAVKAGKAPPAPPAVDLVLELKNTSKNEVKVWVSGNAVQLDLDLKGPGALSVKPPLVFTAVIAPPKAITLAPGKTHTIPVKSLKYGKSGMSDWAYWTKAGEYTLAATYKTGINPPPKGSTKRGGFDIVTLTAAPLKLKVEEK